MLLIVRRGGRFIRWKDKYREEWKDDFNGFEL